MDSIGFHHLSIHAVWGESTHWGNAHGGSIPWLAFIHTDRRSGCSHSFTELEKLKSTRTVIQSNFTSCNRMLQTITTCIQPLTLVLHLTFTANTKQVREINFSFLSLLAGAVLVKLLSHCTKWMNRQKVWTCCMKVNKSKWVWGIIKYELCLNHNMPHSFKHGILSHPVYHTFGIRNWFHLHHPCFKILHQVVLTTVQIFT